MSIVYCSDHLNDGLSESSTTPTGNDRVVTDVNNDGVCRSHTTTVISEVAVGRFCVTLVSCWSVNVHVVNSDAEPSARLSTDFSGHDRSSCRHSFQQVASVPAAASVVTLLSFYMSTAALPCLPFVVVVGAAVVAR